MERKLKDYAVLMLKGMGMGAARLRISAFPVTYE